MMSCVKMLVAKLSLAAMLLACSSLISADEVGAYLFGEDASYYESVLNPSTKPFRKLWIADPEVRLTPEQDARGLNTETYSLRFRPTSRLERTAEHRLFDIEEELAALELEDMLGSMLKQRYLHIIEIAEYEALLGIAEKERSLTQSEAETEESRSSELRYNVSNLQKVLLEIELKQQHITQLESQINRLRASTGISAPELAPHRASSGAAQLTRNLVTPAGIESVLDSDRLKTFTGAIDHRFAQARLKESKQKNDLQKNRGRFGLDLVELSYENKGIDSYNMTFGFRLPTRGYGGRKTARAYLAAQRTADLTSKLVSQQTHKAIQEVYLDLESFYLSDDALKNFSQRSTRSDLATAIVAQRHQLLLEERTVIDHANALRALVEALETTGLIYQRPLINWLASP
ncbi:MAG: hypothetical protein GKR90_22350 [Pseudomonadales bacterium]|nr:hypothetical protein [Pseudomonadales bacterium]